ncbi:MAG: hypothetical protein AAF226_19420, partial [Verrucomicrobiota bacterium]
LKSPLAAAGRGNRVVSLGNPMPAQLTYPLLIEPFHQRIFDFSVQYEIRNREIKFLGMVRQKVDEKGRYLGSVVPQKFSVELPEAIARFLNQIVLPVYKKDSPLPDRILQWTNSLDYSGPIGIDSYLYQDSKGNLKHRQLCELNPRYTMGRVALELKKRVAPGIHVGTEIRRLKPGDEVNLRTPQLNSNGQLETGQIMLNELHSDTRFGFIITVDKQLSAI